MNIQEKLHIVRLSAEATANRDDASLWRWYADLVEDRRISFTCKANVWTIIVDGAWSVSQGSFDSAVREAHERHERKCFAGQASATRQRVGTSTS
jgi:hypothetical protein